MLHFDPLVTTLSASVATGFMHSILLIAQTSVPSGAAADLSNYLSVIEKVGVVGGACVCCYFLYKAVTKKDEQLWATHQKHLDDIEKVNALRVEDFKAQIEYLKTQIEQLKSPNT